jgi:hypothetical protein
MAEDVWGNKMCEICELQNFSANAKDCLGGLGILGLLFVIDLSEQLGKCHSFLFCFSLQVKQFTGTANMWGESRHKPGNTTRGLRFDTVDLLIKIACFV